ncbi:CHASE domain-containing protein [Loktanella sp. SALINAS62]|uniref:CHASE domain-containing protein n=1 Tax=Loktanella sp. SALINAS62 TaxID=2706124 RepID=UPI001B8C9343|nr:CHASE domain-containing protein [Loktanella sp. SALINAS62]MBS1303881.1 PAS domain S-box protein [Loktanella sp. SALINAS62]
MIASIRQLAVPAMVVLTGLSTWLTYDLARDRNLAAFDALIEDSRMVLQQRFASVSLVLDGLSGFLDASVNVTQQDWLDYTDALGLADTLPTVAGVGLIQPVDGNGLTEFLNDARQDYAGEIVIYPVTDTPDKMVIRYIEPLARNAAARGLDIAFEANRRTAAVTARDQMQTQLSGPLTLVQGGTDQVGFLMLRPRYNDGMPLDTVDQRRAAFLDWVYAPLFADRILSNLGAGQDQLFTLTVIDAQDADQPIFGVNRASDARLTHTETVSIFGRDWTITWASTPAFSQTQSHYIAFFVLVSGIVITILLIAYLSVLRESETMQRRQIKSNEERNRAIVDNAVFGVMVLNHCGDILSVNSAAVDLLERDKDAMYSVRLDQLVDRTEKEDGWTFAQATATTPAGRRIYLELQRNNWTSATGELRQTVILRDVTQQTENAVALQQAEERWNMALSGADIGVFDIDLETNTVIVSDTWRRLMRISDDAPMSDIQRIFMSRVHPDDVSLIEQAHRDCIADDKARSITQFRVAVDDGNWHYMKSDAVVVGRDQKGRAKRLVGAQTDIQALLDAQAALIASEERMRLAQAHAPVGMTIIDANGKLTDPNAALATLTGRSREELSDLMLSDLFHPAESERIVAAVIDLQGHPTRTYKGEHRLHRPTGPECWGLVKVSWAPNPTQRDDLFILQVNDITQEKEAARVKSEFVATVSHELRTPLTSINGALGLMAKAGANAPPRLLEIAQANVARLIYLVNDILDLEKISSGKLAFHIGAHKAITLAHRAIEQNAPYADRHNVGLYAQDTTDGASIMADPDRIAQVLSNLFSNAAKFAPDGSEVRLTISSTGPDVCFSVVDTGPGVPAAFRDRIFQAFSQADSSDTRTKGGTGLGLNISRQIVETMGGKIGFDCQPNQTTFWFTCPAADSPAKETTPCIPSEDRRKQILHLEEDADFAEIVRLSVLDFADVTRARSLKKLRSLMHKRPFDIIIIDWEVSDGDAAEILDDLTGAQPQAQLIALSAMEPQNIDERVRLSLTKSRKCVEEIAMQIKTGQGEFEAA